MQVEHIAYYEIEHNAELRELFSIEPDEDFEIQMSDTWLDCDHVKLYGEAGRGDYRFIDVKCSGVRYIIHDCEPEPEAVEMIDWWLGGREGQIEIENTWEAWATVEKGVAYRGGSGYCYALYARELRGADHYDL